MRSKYRCAHVGCKDIAYIYAEFPIDNGYGKNKLFKMGHWCKKHLIEAIQNEG